MTMYTNCHNSNIFILDSQYQLNRRRGSNEQAFMFLYNEDLFLNPELSKNCSFSKEKYYIEQFKKFNKTSVQNYEGDKTRPPSVITMGRKMDSGSLFIHKPANTIFYYQKEFDLFFKCALDYLIDIFEGTNNDFQYFVPNLDQFFDFLDTYVNEFRINQSITMDQEKTLKQFSSVDDLKNFLEDFKSSSNSAFEDYNFGVYMGIDWSALGYDFQSYSADNTDEFKQMAMDLTDSGIDLNEKEQDIWCNKLISLMKMNNELKSSEESIRQDFYETIKIKQEHRSLNEQVSRANNRPNNPIEKSKKQHKAKML